MDLSACLELTAANSAADDTDATTITSLFQQLAVNDHVPSAVFSSFKRSTDVHFVYNFDDDGEERRIDHLAALRQLNQFLVDRGLVTSFVPDASSSSSNSPPSSSSSHYRQLIDNSTVCVFCLTDGYMAAVNASTASGTQPSPCQREFQYLSLRKSFLKLLPIVLEDSRGLGLELGVEGGAGQGGWEGPVGVLLGGRSGATLHCRCPVTARGAAAVPVPSIAATKTTTATATVNTVIAITATAITVGTTATAADISTQQAATCAQAVYDSVVGAFVHNCHRAVRLRAMAVWMRDKCPGIHPAKLRPYALAFMDM
jgi:hypothetical protein